MLKTIITAVITYLATSIDEIPVLFMLYMDSAHRGKGKTITFSYFLGTFLLVAAGLFGAAGLNLLPVKWAIGLIGIIPFVMGIKILIKGDEDEEEAMEKSKKFTALWLKVLIITLSLGADDLGVYIPLFTSLDTMEILQMIIVFAIGTGILCLISYRLTAIDPLVNFIEKRERFFTGVVFIAVGIMVMIKCRTFAGIIGLF
jgi:cadmium resistance transport/sequestration family protein